MFKNNNWINDNYLKLEGTVDRHLDAYESLDIINNLMNKKRDPIPFSP